MFISFLIFPMVIWLILMLSQHHQRPRRAAPSPVDEHVRVRIIIQHRPHRSPSPLAAMFCRGLLLLHAFPFEHLAGPAWQIWRADPRNFIALPPFSPFAAQGSCCPNPHLPGRFQKMEGLSLRSSNLKIPSPSANLFGLGFINSAPPRVTQGGCVHAVAFSSLPPQVPPRLSELLRRF